MEKRTEDIVRHSKKLEITVRVSFYPNLGIRNKWAPAHLPKEIFCKLYERFFEERKKIPKKDPKNYVYKIILNSRNKLWYSI